MARKKPDPDKAHAQACKEIIKRLHRFTKREYGPECDDFEAGCICCRAWAAVHTFEGVLFDPTHR